MKKIEINGLSGLLIEVYDKNNKFTDIEMMREAEKAIRRAVINYENRIDFGVHRQPNSDSL